MSRSLLRAAAAVPCALALVAGAALPATAALVNDPVVLWADDAPFTVAPTGTYETGVFSEDGGAAEIVAHFPAEQRLLVVNAVIGAVEVLDVSDPAAPTKLSDVQTAGVLSADGSIVPDQTTPNSVAVRADGLGAIAVEAPTKTDPGWVVFFDAAGDGEALGAVRVGSLPDMVAFTPDGSELLVANEGEPDEDYTVDPEGSVSVVLVPAGVDAATQESVLTADFHAFEAPGALHEDVRVFGPTVNAAFPVSANLEPEYITFSADSATAYVTLQEANAIATVDVASAAVTSIDPLGFKDWSTSALDPSDRDDAIAIRPWPVLGMYQPDGIDSYSVGGETYLVTANEGDAREWGDFVEETRVEDLAVCESVFTEFAGQPGYPATAEEFLTDGALGRLNVTTENGYDAEAGCYTELYTFGGRSFSVWHDGALVFDSGDAFEQLAAAAVPEYFNSDHAESSFDNRSDNKGPEPEGIVIGEIAGAPYAFIGFERLSGFAVYGLSDPAAPTFVGYFNNRDFAFSSEPEEDGAPVVAEAGDTGPEGLAFIAAADSPTGQPMLAVGNEISGSTTLYSIVLADAAPAPGATPPAEDPELAATGADATVVAIAGGLMLALGGILVMRLRARRA